MGNLNIQDQNDLTKFFYSQPVQRAYLFGSAARGDSNNNSDIDVLVELDEKTDIFQLVSIQLQLEKLLNKRVDVVSANGLSARFKQSIDKEKILIYEKQNH